MCYSSLEAFEWVQYRASRKSIDHPEKKICNSHIEHVFKCGLNLFFEYFRGFIAVFGELSSSKQKQKNRIYMFLFETF